MLLKQYKQILFTLIASALFLPMASILAYEINYPELIGYGGGPGFEFTSLFSYFIYFFWFLVISAGTIGIISIVISGFKILVSFGQPEKVGEAKKNIISIIIGIVLLMTSVIILTRINTEFINPPTAVLPTVAEGVFFKTTTPCMGCAGTAPDGFIYKISTGSSENIAKTINLTAPIELYYKCASASGPNLLVWQYGLEGYFVNDDAKTKTVACNTSLAFPDTVKSYRHYLELPGVYFYKTEDCGGSGDAYSSFVHRDTREINFVHGSNIHSMRIFNGIKRDEKYGVILTRGSGGKGECSEPIWKSDSGGACYKSTTPGGLFPRPLNDITDYFYPAYAYILKYDPDIATMVGNPNKEINFYSNNLIARIPQTGYVPVSGVSGVGYSIGVGLIYDGNPDNIIKEIGKQGINGPSNYECCTKQSTFALSPECFSESATTAEPGQPTPDPNAPCLKYFKIFGAYYVILYTKTIQHKEPGCIVRDKDEEYLSSFLINKELYKTAIIPKY